jgi:broad specificity phosphatase PhoE
MRTVELRRHAERDEDEDLTERGLAEATRTRDALEFPYDAYYVSAAKRARLTMEAFGIRDAVVDPRLGPRSKPPFARFGNRHEALMAAGMDAVTAWFAIPECVPLLLENGRVAGAAVRDIAANVPEGGRALAVSHGGTIEPIIVALLGRSYAEVFGTRELAYCEGVRVVFRGSEPARVDVLRSRA